MNILISKDKKGKIGFEPIKNKKYNITSNSKNIIKIESLDKKYELTIELLHEPIHSSSITKEDIDFNFDDYHDYNKVKKENYNGWEVYKGDYEYEIDLVLTEPEETSLIVYAVDIKVNKLNNEKTEFDIKEFVESDEFLHILNTLKLEEI